MRAKDDTMIKKSGFLFQLRALYRLQSLHDRLYRQAQCESGRSLAAGAGVSGGEWLPVGDAFEQNVFAYYVSLSCNHCENPVCANGCPTQAMHKDENGIVSIDESRCVGCRYCEWNCPYGAPQFDPQRKKVTNAISAGTIWNRGKIRPA